MPEDLLLFTTNRIKKMAVCKTTYVSEHLNQWFANFSARSLPIKVYNFLYTPWPTPTVTNARKVCAKINLSTFYL